MPAAFLWFLLALLAPFSAAAPAAKPSKKAASPGKRAAPQGEAASAGKELKWLELYANPNPLEGDQVPTFFARLSSPADLVELRINTITLELNHSKEFAKPTRLSAAGEAVYEYRWPGASALPKGVYFFMFRAVRVRDKALAGRPSRCGEAEFKSGQCQAATEMRSLKIVR